MFMIITIICICFLAAMVFATMWYGSGQTGWFRVMVRHVLLMFAPPAPPSHYGWRSDQLRNR